MSDSAFTKRAIADSVKELTKSKSFDKIGVVDITEKCGINLAEADFAVLSHAHYDHADGLAALPGKRRAIGQPRHQL